MSDSSVAAHTERNNTAPVWDQTWGAKTMSAIKKRDNVLVLAKDEPNKNGTGSVSPRPWKIIVIDDEQDVHLATKLVLSDIEFQGAGLEMISGYSAEQAKILLEENPDVAILLLDVVMESETAGLDVIKYVREQLKNHFVRIILRTGQPGEAPEDYVITRYDINDYKDKSELSARKLKTTIITSLRSYHDLVTINSLSQENAKLQTVTEQKNQELTKAVANLQNEVESNKRLNAELHKSYKLLDEAQRIARIGHWEWNPHDNTIELSDQALRILGFDEKRRRCKLNEFINLIPSEDNQRVKETLENFAIEQKPYEILHLIQTQNGRQIVIHQHGEPVFDKQGNFLNFIGTLQDITLQQRTEQEMRQLYLALDQIADVVMITDTKGFVTYVNPAFTTTTGYESEEIIGKKPALLKSGIHKKEFYSNLWSIVSKGGVFKDIIVNRKKSGDLYYEEKTISPLKDSQNHITHYIATGRDITNRMKDQERLYHLAHHDALTGLPNRSLLHERLEQIVARGRWNNRKAAILLLDMDRFKVINDTLGHDVGDRLLESMAERLQHCVREGDTVARLGGDEFAIVLNDLKDAQDVPNLAEKILASIATPFQLEKQELFITTSIGISVYPKDGEDSHTLLKNADVAMYQAKAKGKNNYQFYTASDHARAQRHLMLETELRKAIDNNELTLAYQPQVELKTHQISGFEALLRWQHPSLLTIPPCDFIPLLEETGLIIPVTEWLMDQVCGQIKQWENALPNNPWVSINLSSQLFNLKNLTDQVSNAISKAGIEPNRLKIEITEDLLIGDFKRTSATINELAELGVNTSIDDFGTGYSSMNYLKQLPVDTLKIDKSFIVGLGDNKENNSITSAIIALAHSLNISVTAEGVETLTQLEYLRQRSCDHVQGFLFCPPLPADLVTNVRISRQVPLQHPDAGNK